MSNVVARYAAALIKVPEKMRTLHYIGLPPELAGTDDRQLLGWPVALVLDVDSEGNALVCRYGRNREFLGDTWHTSIDEAKEDIAVEYGPGLGPWEPIPPEERDAVSYALRLARPS